MRQFLLPVLMLFFVVAPMSRAETRKLDAIHTDGVWAIAYSPNGKLLATAGGDGKVRIWDATTLTLMQTLVQSTQRFQVYDVHFLSDNRRVVAAALGGKPRVWDALTGELILVLEGHEENVIRIAESKDGSLFYTAGSDDTVMAWDSVDYHIVGRFHTHSPVSVVALDRRGQILVTSLSGIFIADVLEDRIEQTIDTSAYYFASAGMIGGQVYTGGSLDHGAVPRAYDAASGQGMTIFTGLNDGFIWNMASTSVRGLMAASSFKGPAMAWEVASGRALYTSQDAGWNSLSVAFSPSGDELAVGDTVGSVRFESMVPSALRP